MHADYRKQLLGIENRRQGQNHWPRRLGASNQILIWTYVCQEESHSQHLNHPPRQCSQILQTHVSSPIQDSMACKLPQGVNLSNHASTIHCLRPTPDSTWHHLQTGGSNHTHINDWSGRRRWMHPADLQVMDIQRHERGYFSPLSLVLEYAAQLKVFRQQFRPASTEL